jgi:hypothetical protein
VEISLANAGLYHGPATYQANQGKLKRNSGQRRGTEATAEAQEAEGATSRAIANVLIKTA